MVERWWIDGVWVLEKGEGVWGGGGEGEVVFWMRGRRRREVRGGGIMIQVCYWRLFLISGVLVFLCFFLRVVLLVVIW